MEQFKFRAVFASIFLLLIFGKIHGVNAPITWSSPPSIVSNVTVNSTAPAVAISGQGNAVAVWVAQELTNFAVKSAVLPASSTVWSNISDLSSFGSNAVEPKIDMDASGNAVAVWLESDGTNLLVNAATLPAGSSGWVPSTAFLSATGEDANTPELAVNLGGNAISVWSRSNGTNTIIQAATLLFGSSTWVPTTDLSAIGEDASAPQVALDPITGDAIAVWVRSDGVNNIIQGAKLLFGSTVWTPTSDLSLPGEDASEPQIEITSAGNAIAVWTRSNGTNTIIQGATLAFGSSVWVPTTDLSAVGENAAEPRLGVDGVGNAVAVWVRSNGANTIIQGATLASGSSVWTSTTDLSAVGENADDPQLVVSEGGDAYAVWERNNGVNIIVQSATLSAGSASWIPATNNVSSNGVDADQPQIVVDNNSGGAIVVWHLVTMPGIIESSFTVGPFPGKIVQPASNLIGKQIRNRFPAESELFNFLHWTASPSPNIFYYLIYRNGVLIAQVGSDQLKYKDHRRKKGVTYVYQVIAVNEEGEESDPISVTIN